MLPNHIVVHILSFLTLTELATTHSVCKSMADACDDDAVWMPRCKRFVGEENGTEDERGGEEERRGGETRRRGEEERQHFMVFNYLFISNCLV